MVQEKIDAYLLKEEASKANRTRSGLWSPSSFGKCYRAQYWNRLNEPKSNTIEAKTLRIYRAGHIFHKFVQDILKGEYMVEVMIKSDDTLGYADLVNLFEVVDIKSVRSYAFKLMKDKRKKFDFENEKLPNILQVTWYGRELRKEKGRLVFIDKDSLDIIEYEFYISTFLEKLKEELDILNGFWSKKKIPPKGPRCYNGKECSYCDWEDKCKGEKNVTARED